MSASCRHRNDSSIAGVSGKLPNHKWAEMGYHSHLIWVTCPLKFGGAVTHNSALWRWAIDGFRGPLIWSDILWVLSPDPGCEL